MRAIRRIARQWIECLPSNSLKVDAIKAKLEKATQHIDPNAQTPSPATGDGNGSREAMRHRVKVDWVWSLISAGASSINMALSGRAKSVCQVSLTHLCR